MEAYYRVKNLEIIYKPVVRLDQKLFPSRWVCPSTSKEQYEVVFKNFDLKRIHEMSEPPNRTPEPTPVGVGHSTFAGNVGDPAWLSLLR